MEDWASAEILLIDDDLEFCSMLSNYLGKQGFRVTAVHDGKAGLDAALSRLHAIVLLDVMLPDLDGFEILRRLNASPDIRVLLLTARGDDIDRILGLEIGADDYLTKPFNPRELVARIRAVLRRSSGAQSGRDGADTSRKILRIAGLELDTSTRKVSANGVVTDLTGVEFTLLEMLLRSPGEVLAREELTEAVLGRKFYQFDRALDMHVCRLRRKLDQLCGMGDQVKTIRGVGYHFAMAGKKEA